MKKTTIILICMLGLLAASSFIMPLILFSAKVHKEFPKFALSGKDSTLVLDQADSLMIANQYFLTNPNNVSEIISFTIEESDSVKAPVVKGDAALIELMNISGATNDCGINSIEFNFHQFIDPDGFRSVELSTAAPLNVTIVVPAGNIKYVKSNAVNLVFSNFRDADMTVETESNIKILNSSFRRMD